MKDVYDKLFKKEKTFREEWEGRIGIEYRVPKEISYIINFLKGKKNLTILELGAGDGYTSKIIINALNPKKYVATEFSKEGVKKIKKRGIKAIQMDATDLHLQDSSFDVVIAFNTMHHVNVPKKMGQEMMRVSKKYFLLCEANGLSLPRKILEHTKRNKEAGEKSYTPRKYKSFFKGCKYVEVKPFMFAFAFTPNILFNFAIVLSELAEKITFLRWQGSSLFIWGEK